MDLDDPTAVALAAAEALDRARIEHALYGGLVLAAYGTPRETRDADLAVAGATATGVSRAFASAGLRTEIAFERIVFGGLWLCRLTLLGGGEHTGLNTVDLVEPRDADYARRALSRALPSALRGQPLRVLGPEDFVVFKVLSTREQDLIDAGSVLGTLGTEVDRALVERELSTLAGAIPDHPVAERWRRLLEAALS